MHKNDILTGIAERLDVLGQPVELINKRHGGPYDRGGADSWYRRGAEPHYYLKGSMTSPKVTEADMTEQEILEYEYGYWENEAFGDHKEWD